MKILLFDIETSPIMANVWSLWSECKSMKMVDLDWYVLSWSAKWLDGKKITTKALPDYKKTYKKNPVDDSALLKDIWDLLDQADFVIGHNAQKFDVKKLNARFMLNGMLPPSPYRMIDTLKEAKAHFAFTSNKLDSLGELLGCGRKVEHEGFELWRKCMNGDLKAWKNMCKYNEQDVILLEKVYLKLRPFMKNHPNVNLDGKVSKCKCPACGSSNLIKRGYAYTNASKFARLRCKDCGKWSREKITQLNKGQRKNIIANIM
jgi:hypothetical protein